MAYNLVTNGLVQSAGITYSATTIDSTDWASVPNDTRFYDFDTKIVYYKDVSGNIIEVFSTSGGTVTSVGLTMPSAFGVANSPVTGSGTLNVTVVGNASQYIRGDGTLATLPTSSGGGSSVSYYLNGSINQGVFGGDTYYQLSKTAIIGGGTNFNIATNGIIARFITDANDPDQLTIPNGAWNLRFYFSADSSGGTPEFYINLYKYDTITFTFTLISSGSTNPEVITNGTAIDQYFTSIGVPTTALAVTDRLAVEVYVINDTKTITLHTEDSHLCQIVTTFATGLTALNGLTDSVQYFAVGTSGTDFGISSVGDTHTFNLPFADATNTGKLSSTDWNTFNNKLDINIYNGDGTLTSNRTISATDKTFTLSGNNASTIFTFNISDGANVSSIIQENDTITNLVTDAGSTLVSQTFMNNASWSIDIIDPTNQGTIDVSTTAIQLRVTQGLAIKKIIVGTSGIQINSAYYLPNTDGTAGQFVTTDGAGNLSFATSTSTNIYNSNGVLTGARTVDLAGYNLTFNDLVGTGSFTALIDDNAGSYGQLSVSVGQVLLETVSSSSGTGKYISVTPTSINIAGYYNLPVSASPSLNQIIYASSTSQLNFTSLKTINSNSIIGSGNISVGTVDTLTTIGTSGVATLVGSTLNIPNYTFTDTNIYNTNGTLTSNRTATLGNFNLIFSGLGTSSSTQFSRSNGGGTQSSFVLQYNSVSLGSNNTTDSTSLSLTPSQFLTSISDFGSNNTIIQQLSTSIRLLVNDSIGTLNTLEVTGTGININNNYTLPIIDGTANQVLQTNGSGILSFATITFNVITQSGASYSASTSDYVLINASTFILTLPSASANAQVGVKMINATVTSIQVKTASAGVTIDGTDRSSTGLGLYNQYDAYVFISNGTNWFIVS